MYPLECRESVRFNNATTVFDNHLVDVFLDNQVIQLALWDTAGQEDYARLRPLSYPGTDCVLLCYAIDKPTSYDNIESVWMSELKLHCPSVPFLLIGCKTDLRSDPDTLNRLHSEGRNFVTYQEGVALAQRIGAWRYMECSAKLNEGVGDVFEFATRAATWSAGKGDNSKAPTTFDGGRPSESKQSVNSSEHRDK
ncbi:UNVERIFIED_CONTAM: GTP-binding protein Rho1, partial [Siphonaria sp. JEL0065]